ncbi:carboxypeptidase-like regulatory domain-containing protein [Niabella hibiscisoli]|uniref:carboxypeptidase-like regulatory domain-containing protein n=1 Tax=Niabella hibiscisoli TaxID=1825928 RepID=UPI001F0E274F|nr:carboxypeptidase-like regulatory domain-containing protein [Niabella hibiscisoli]MCH5716664.1 carboxypeptidase-like regulatory domain-containing protein [Niabella hibiscisoli]
MLQHGCLFCPNLQAQQTGVVKGTVTNEKGQPAEKVTIGVTNNSIFATTDNKGAYLLSLPAGKHTVTATMVGYESQNAEINITEDKTVILNIRLKKSKQEDLEEVIVGGVTKKEH